MKEDFYFKPPPKWVVTYLCPNEQSNLIILYTDEEKDEFIKEKEDNGCKIIGIVERDY